MKLHLARNTKLLIAEDQVLAKSHMHYALEQLGFKNMNYVDRPSHALSALQEHDYDAIICSYNLRSEQGGYFLLEQLNETQSLPLTSAESGRIANWITSLSASSNSLSANRLFAIPILAQLKS